MIDTWWAVPDKNHEAFPINASLKAFVVHDVHHGRVNTKWNYYSRTPPQVCTPSAYLTSPHTMTDLPGLPLHIAYCKDWRWEWPWNQVSTQKQRVGTAAVGVGMTVMTMYGHSLWTVMITADDYLYGEHSLECLPVAHCPSPLSGIT